MTSYMKAYSYNYISFCTKKGFTTCDYFAYVTQYITCFIVLVDADDEVTGDAAAQVRE